MAAGIAAGTALAILAGFGLWQAHRLWRDPSYAGRMMLFNSVLPFSKGVRRGAVRGALPLAVGLGLAAAGVIVVAVVNPKPGHPTIGAIAGVVCFGLMLVAFAFHVAIIWFNHPLWLVPPHMREDKGIVAARQRHS